MGKGFPSSPAHPDQSSESTPRSHADGAALLLGRAAICGSAEGIVLVSEQRHGLIEI